MSERVEGAGAAGVSAETDLIATSLDGLLDALSLAVVASGRPQVLIAHEAGLSTKHLSQMMTGRVTGSLAAWQRVIDSAGITFTAQVQVLRPESPTQPTAAPSAAGGADGGAGRG